jgi:hypothetical protein
VCIGGVATETQVLHMTPHEARDWVMAGRPGRSDVAVSRSIEDADSLGEPTATVASSPTLTVVRDTAESSAPVTLAEASCDRGSTVVALRFDALRQAARRDPEFPRPVGQRGQARLYEPGSLVRWQRNRPGTKGQVL